jgi:hypothetical protein
MSVFRLFQIVIVLIMVCRFRHRKDGVRSTRRRRPTRRRCLRLALLNRHTAVELRDTAVLSLIFGPESS